MLLFENKYSFGKCYLIIYTHDHFSTIPCALMSMLTQTFSKGVEIHFASFQKILN